MGSQVIFLNECIEVKGMMNLSQLVGKRKLDLIGKKYCLNIRDNIRTAGMSMVKNLYLGKTSASSSTKWGQMTPKVYSSSHSQDVIICVISI